MAERSQGMCHTPSSRCLTPAAFESGGAGHLTEGRWELSDASSDINKKGNGKSAELNQSLCNTVSQEHGPSDSCVSCCRTPLTMVARHFEGSQRARVSRIAPRHLGFLPKLLVLTKKAKRVNKRCQGRVQISRKSSGRSGEREGGEGANRASRSGGGGSSQRSYPGSLP